MNDHSANDSGETVPSHRAPDPPASPPPGAPGPPRYALRDEVARGGMGAVYRAYDSELDREVAVKALLPGQDADRFVIEARVTARLPHPGVPPVYSLGHLADGRPFLAMKLVRGRTLRDELNKATPADLPRLLGALARICEAVGFAHSRGIVHRDLKPANVMVGDFGEVYVMDWGLAKELRGAEPGARNEGSKVTAGSQEGGVDRLGAVPVVPDPAFPTPRVDETTPGTVKGTPAYMAPEQARGEPVDARADVFALGGILAAMLTGKPPFGGATAMDVVCRAAKADLAPCFARLDACAADPELVSLAKWCLAAKAADRPADGAAVAAAVTGHLEAAEARAREAELKQVRAEEQRTRAELRAEEQRKRRAVQVRLVAALGALAVAVAVGAGATLWQAGEADKARLREQARQAEVVAAESRAAAQRRLTAHNQAVVRFSVATYTLRAGVEGRDPKLLEQSEQGLRLAVAGLEQLVAEVPDEPTHAHQLGLCYISLCEVLCARGRPADLDQVVGYADRAEGLFQVGRGGLTIGPFSPSGATERAVPAEWTDQSTRGGPASVLPVLRFTALLNQRRMSEALEALDRLRPEAAPATPALAPGADPPVPDFGATQAQFAKLPAAYSAAELTGPQVEQLVALRTVLLRAAEMEQARTPWSRGPGADHAKAVRLARHLGDARGAAGAGVYNAACQLALAAAAPGLDPDRRERLSADAVAYLARLEAGGYFRHPAEWDKRRRELAADPDLDALRGRPDFARVLEAVARAPAVAPAPRPR